MGNRNDVLVACQQRIGYNFRTPSLLRDALQPGVQTKKLAYVGDAVLRLVLREQSMARGDSPGTSTLACSKLESNENLKKAGIAVGIDISINDKDESDRVCVRHKKTVADAVEAILGAAYYDGGLEDVAKIMRKLGLTLPRLKIKAAETGKRNKTRKAEVQQAPKVTGHGDPLHKTISGRVKKMTKRMKKNINKNPEKKEKKKERAKRKRERRKEEKRREKEKEQEKTKEAAMVIEKEKAAENEAVKIANHRYPLRETASRLKRVTGAQVPEAP